jgi:hypothetical protein
MYRILYPPTKGRGGGILYSKEAIMKTVQVKLYKAIILVLLAVGFPAFIFGWVVAVNFSGVFETGYKMAFMDIKSAIKESVSDSQKYFYMHGIKFSTDKFTECTDPVSGKIRKARKGGSERATASP